MLQYLLIFSAREEEGMAIGDLDCPHGRDVTSQGQLELTRCEIPDLQWEMMMMRCERSTESPGKLRLGLRVLKTTECVGCYIHYGTQNSKNVGRIGAQNGKSVG